jgi:hypothetical protein
LVAVAVPQHHLQVLVLLADLVAAALLTTAMLLHL